MIALVGLYFWRQRRGAAFSLVSASKSTGLEEAIWTKSPLPDPDPLLDFDLETATARNYVYVNKTVRHPYYQVRAPHSVREATVLTFS